ncbi:MAG: FAD-binding protein, partial [Clostridia bacterium]|nr:FAD-binding protein [Clostridia bacterium]
SYNRTAYAGASTGKQIVTALIRETRKYECSGKIERIVGLNFYSALIKNKRCYGALFHNKVTNALEPIYADSVVIATGGQNQLFGKTTGTALCDGYVAGELFLQGAVLKNLEFIQYHPTTIETSLKRMLISEAARGEGGRLYYLDGDKRVYFMEERFGEKGNLMPRDVVSRCMFELGKPIFLDVSFLGEETILSKIGEVYDLCKSYLNIDITKESIPVAPSVHFFMGGLAVDKNHRTSIENIYAVGECASIYHGANRLGGNSLLAAVHSGRVAAADIKANNNENEIESFGDYIEQENKTLNAMCQVENGKSPIAIFNNLATIMKSNLGIVRSGDDLKSTISVIDEIIESSNEVDLSKSLSTYQAYSVRAILTLARAMATCANERKETRGAHIRKDYPDTKEEYEKCSLIKYDNGEYIVRYEKEDEICW